MILTGVYLSLNGKIYANNSVISITEIGETDITTIPPTLNSNNALQCITDKSPCCATQSRAGEWFFPNKTIVPIEGNAMMTFYRNRGDDGTINLNRFNASVLSPTGLFCCEVPDAERVNQTACVTIGKQAYKFILV